MNLTEFHPNPKQFIINLSLLLFQGFQFVSLTKKKRSSTWRPRDGNSKTLTLLKKLLILHGFPESQRCRAKQISEFCFVYCQGLGSRSLNQPAYKNRLRGLHRKKTINYMQPSTILETTLFLSLISALARHTSWENKRTLARLITQYRDIFFPIFRKARP